MSNSDRPRDPAVIVNPWQALRRLTPARIALGRTGVSQPTAAHLAFQLAHAQARDAVHLALDVPRLLQDLAAAGALAQGDDAAAPAAPVLLQSAAPDRACYLQRPDLGRRLDAASRERLQDAAGTLQAAAGTAARDASADFAESAESAASAAPQLAIVLADGLSALALQRQAPPLLAALLPRLAADGWTLAPLTIVRQARVAIGDEIGALLGARLVAILIGERPGLSSPDSLGIYLTWQPQVGTPDSRRNCISNVRPAGLAPAQAALRLHYLLDQARRRQLTGVGLKDDSQAAAAPDALGGGAAFLLGG